MNKFDPLAYKGVEVFLTNNMSSTQTFGAISQTNKGTVEFSITNLFTNTKEKISISFSEAMRLKEMLQRVENRELDKED